MRSDTVGRLRDATPLDARAAAVLAPSVVVPVGGILISEAALYLGRLDLALWGHVATLFVCVFAPLRLADEADLFHVFALVPLFRLVNLGMPIFFELTLYSFPLIYAPLLPAAYLVAHNRAIAPLSFRPKTALLWVPIAVVGGALLAHVEYRIITPEALVPAWTLPNLLLITVVMVGFVGFVEELLFRGILQGALEMQLGRWPGLLLASVVFGAMHSAYGTPAELAFAGTIGLLFGIIYDRTQSLLVVTLMHGALNVFLFAVIPIRGSLLPL